MSIQPNLGDCLSRGAFALKKSAIPSQQFPRWVTSKVEERVVRKHDRVVGLPRVSDYDRHPRSLKCEGRQFFVIGHALRRRRSRLVPMNV
ncbi:hypothetical protein J2X76_006067 [Neorhizobium sp. 2083]|nr:hypothetical protein [Neorhizobium sp. 2083]